MVLLFLRLVLLLWLTDVQIMGLEGQSLHQSMLGWEPVYLEENLAVVSVGFMLDDPNQAIIWRGPKKNSVLSQL